MRKETKKEERIVIDSYTVYIAEDGKEFDSERDCTLYEKNCKLNEIEPQVEALKIHKLNGIAPLTVNEDFPERSFNWYNIKNIEEYELLEEYYEMSDYSIDYMCDPDLYPAIVCVMESDDFVETMYFDTITRITKWFYEQFGYTVEIKKNN